METNEVLQKITESYLPRAGELTLGQNEIAEVTEALPQGPVARVVHIDSFEVEEEEAPEGEGQNINYYHPNMK